MLEQRLRQPRRELRERIARRLSETRQLHRIVAPDGFDEGRARPIPCRSNLPDERRGFERHAAARQWTDDEQALAGAKVEADADGELAVLTQSRVEIAGRHAVGT